MAKSVSSFNVYSHMVTVKIYNMIWTYFIIQIYIYNMHTQMVMTQVITTCEVFINYNLSKEGISLTYLFSWPFFPVLH